IVFFKDFPAGYLLSGARPDTNSAWIASVAVAKTEAYQRTILRYWRGRGLPDMAVVVKRIPYDPRRSSRVERYRADTPLMRLIRSSYLPISTKYNYVLYERRGSTCGVAD